MSNIIVTCRNWALSDRASKSSGTALVSFPGPLSERRKTSTGTIGDQCRELARPAGVVAAITDIGVKVNTDGLIWNTFTAAAHTHTHGGEGKWTDWTGPLGVVDPLARSGYVRTDSY